MDKYAFGNRLYALRTEKGYTQEKLGKMLGVGKTAVSKWENGTTQPRLPMLEKISACFDVTVEELLEYTNEKTNSSDVLEKKELQKELQTELPSEILAIPQLSIKSFLGFSWLNIDAQRFIAEIKNEYGISNREVAEILQLSERKIGLWENGLEKPSPKDNLKIAALYYNNCEDSQKVNIFLDVSKNFKREIYNSIVGFVALILFLFGIIYPLYVMGISAKSMHENNVLPPFSTTGLFMYVLPIASMISTQFVFLKHLQLNRPEIEKTLTSYRLFLAFEYIYLIADCIIYGSIRKTLAMIIAFGIAHCLIHFVIEKVKNEIVKFFVFIVSYSIFVILFCIVAIKMINEFDTGRSTETQAFFFFPIIMFMVLCAYELLYSDIYKFYQLVKSYFPVIKKDSVKIQLKDIVLTVISLTVAVIYFFVIESNKEWLLNLFHKLP